MKKLNLFLDKFEKITPPDDVLRKAVAHAVVTVVGATVAKSKVKIQNTTAFVDVSSLVKNKIRQNKKEIIGMIHDTHPKTRTLLRDVR